jgi:tRNA (guanine37-N1)-methyltransferase
VYRFEVVTLFPPLVEALAVEGITARALAAQVATLRCWNPRDFVCDRHRRVDDRPYGGGPGMVMMAAPLCAATRAARAALEAAGHGRVHTVYLTPQGQRFDQARARALAVQGAIVLVCGRYEGVDERFVEAEIDEELSLGDFVLSGGELAAMAVVDSVTRLLPGALGHADSAVEDSFSGALLDCPHYTRPEVFEGRRVPPVLLSGDHAAVRRWRLEQALERTLGRRPDLLEQAVLDAEQTEVLGVLRSQQAPTQQRRDTASAPGEPAATAAGASDERRHQSDRSGADGPRGAGVRSRRHGGGEGEGA